MEVDVILDTESPVVDVEVANQAGKIIPVLHDDTLTGDGINEPMGVNTNVVSTKDDLAKKADRATTLSGYGITDAYTKAETDAKIGAAYHVKGSVANYDSLPDGASVGDVYNLLDTGANYVWTDNGWDKLSENIDLTAYATKDEVATKQDKLTAGENITIGEDGTISASGGGASGDYLPLSGGTITGPITFEWSGQYMATEHVILKGKYNRTDTGTIVYKDILTVEPTGELTAGYVFKCSILYPLFSDRGTLGGTLLSWSSVYTRKLNAGRQNNVDSGDLILPTQAGTLARLEDIDLVVGDISAALDAINGEAI